jgi:adenosyl cobinamide kinase/adenosyl cobinamide phosphate guanylyltransferase
MSVGEPARAVVTLVLGGARSGKSDFAERLTRAHDGPLLYFATGTATDDDMAARIDRHRSRRDGRFETIECGADLADALRGAPPFPALVDSLGTWVAAQRAFADGATLGPETHDLVLALATRGSPTVVVSDEVGLGVHPSSEAGRHFRDVLGEANQQVAAAAAHVWLVVAGRGAQLPPLPTPQEGRS